MSIIFRKLDEAVASDRNLSGPALRLYVLMLQRAGLENRQVEIRIGEIARLYNRSSRTVQRWLSFLVVEGLIERVFRKHKTNPKWNQENLFIIHGNDAKRYENSEYAKIANQQKVSVGGDTQCHELVTPSVTQIIQNRKKEIIKKNTLKREAKLPKKSNEKTFSYDLGGVPDILKTTAEYWLMKTGKTKMSDNEIKVLRELLDNHTPVRIQKEIDTAVERFVRDGKNPAKQNFAYIGRALSNQKSYKPEKKTSTKRKKISQPETEQQNEVQELSMSVEGAEEIISDHASSTPKEKKLEPLPIALTELFEKIQTKDKEILDNYCSRHVAEVERAKQTKEPERKIELEKMKLEDYLQLKFPEAEEEELHRDYSGHVHEGYNDFPRGHLLEEAFEIDYACAMCQDSKSCHLPEGYSKNTPNRPVVKMPTNKNGEKYLSVDYGERITCKHCHLDKVKADYELEDRIKYSGLTETQTKKTFETFNHKNASPEVIVAKAQAILAAKNQTNLILAGKPGTGKTHLASAIALEAIKNGRRAIFKSLPELLDEICWAHQNCTDAFELMMKYKKVPCLVLDDWGKEKTTDARMDYLFQIIDYRYRNGLQTILTTNALNSEGLKNRWNADKIEPLVSRILENGKWVTICNSENYRLKKSVKHEAEIETELRPEIQASQQEIISEELSIIEEASDVEVSSEANISETLSQLQESFKFEDTAECETQTQEICSDENHEHLTEKSEPPAKEIQTKKSWEEISESAEYKALSEHDKVSKQWEYFRTSSKYENMSLSDKMAVQMYFANRLDEAEQKEVNVSSESVSEHSGCVINIPKYNDGLDDLFKDDEDELKLYGAK